MTDPDGTPAEPSATAPAEAPPAAEAASSAPPRHLVLPWLSLAGFLILAAAIACVWAYPRQPPAVASPSEATLAALSGRLDGLAGELAALGQKLAALPPPPDLAPLAAQVAALENRQPPSATSPDTAALTGRIDTLEKSVAGISARLDRIERLVRVADAAAALAQGRPLGTLPGAPAALARYATAVPPTLASLRLSFPAAARAELAASRPSTAGKSFLQRLLVQAGDLVTLRAGNRVIIGNPAEDALRRARTALDAGDLAASVAALAALPVPAAPAMTEWEGEAKALLAAQAALATLAGTN
ncbi:MAG TPA: hypothetical protein VMF62_16455 [Acetobacteraceae bacterium]|nr:hypothetical protein [Acetobacteraceae bacterium]